MFKIASGFSTLHSVGLLQGSFCPDNEICAICSLRRRDNLIQLATLHLQHMQKALDKMNLQIHHVISDLAGTTGLTIMDAVLAGERDPHKLAQLRHPPIRAGEETIMKSLIGDYREEPPVHVCQSLKAYRHYENSNRCLLSFALSAHLSYGIPNLSALGLWFQSCSVNTCTDTDHDAQHVVKDGSP